MIRKAEQSDQKQIIELQNKFVLNTDLIDQYEELEKRGFLVGDYSAEDFEKDLKKLFLVYEIDNQITGYIRITNNHEYKDNSFKIWPDEKMKKEYYSTPHAEIDTIVVTGNQQTKGIGTQLLKEVEKIISDLGIKYLYSIVSAAPVMNKASFEFHTKNGFEDISSSQPSDLFGIKNYQSILMVKKL